MKFFSVFSIIVSIALIGGLVIIGLPKLAKIKNGDNSMVESMKHTNTAQKENLILRDKCNTYLASAIFASGIEADNFLDSCMNGKETSKINVIRPESTGTSTVEAQTEPRLTKEELAVKCREFMTRARFETQKNADSFLENCLAGK